jgi:hypothetical protein
MLINQSKSMNLAIYQEPFLSIDMQPNPSIYISLKILKMPTQILRTLVKSLLENDKFLTHVEIAKKLKKDKAIVSGYLEAMVDYGDIGARKIGNTKAYFLNDKGKN